MVALSASLFTASSAARAETTFDGKRIFGLFEACVGIMLNGETPEPFGEPFQIASAGEFIFQTFVLDPEQPERAMVSYVTNADGLTRSCGVMASQLRSAPASDTDAIAEAQRLGEEWTEERLGNSAWTRSPLHPERVFDLCRDGVTIRVLVEEVVSPYQFGAKAGVAEKGMACELG